MTKKILALATLFALGFATFAYASDHRGGHHKNGHHGERHRGHHSEKHHGDKYHGDKHGRRSEHHRQCTTTEQSTWQPLAIIMTKAETDGYRLRRASVKGTCYEVVLVKEKSRLMKIYDPSNGSLVDTKERSHHD